MLRQEQFGQLSMQTPHSCEVISFISKSTINYHNPKFLLVMITKVCIVHMRHTCLKARASGPIHL
jgi:hypothetical protein